MAGRYAAAERLGALPATPPATTAIGALLGHITGGHLVTVDVPYLVHVPGQKNRVGAKLVSVTSP